MSLWLFFIAISLLWDYRHDKKAVRFLIGYAAFSLAYFLIINMLVMPRLGNAGDSFKRYEWLGGSYPEIAKYLLTHPGKALNYHQDDFDIRYARHLIKQLPDDAYVCAASMFVPRLAMRDKIEDFEWNIDTEAEYVMIPASYIEKKAYGGETIFAHPEAFEVVETDGILYLFKRKTVVQE